MPKRPLSPILLPPAKRTHTAGTHSSSHTRATFDSLLFDEIVLVIFSYLSWSDLCALQSINRNWSRLSLDNQLWKTLYLREYGRSRLRGVRGFIGRTDGRNVRPLPGRAKSDDVKDWKWMFRISSNWRTGRCSVRPLITGPSLSLPKVIPGEGSDTLLEQSFVLLVGNLTVTATSHQMSLALTSPMHDMHRLPCTTNTGTHITALALNQSPPTSAHHVRLVAFLSSGEFSVFSIDHHTPAHSSRLLTYSPARSSRTSPIVQAVYHHPLLITLSQSFQLSLYDLSSNTVVHTQTLSSFTSYPPTSLVLSTPAPGIHKLVLAYAIPVYPAHWSVGATELLIGSGATVTGTRTARTIDVPQGWVDEHKLRAMREQWARKVSRVADTQTDGKWVVLAPGEPPAPSSSLTPATSSPGMHSGSGLQLYRLYLPASSSAASVPKLTFVRTLHGQIGPISALSLADGRCVSLGVNRSIWVWDLESGTGAEVSGGTGTQAGSEHHSAADVDELQDTVAAKGTVVFDERRIISADAGGVHVWRFDI